MWELLLPFAPQIGFSFVFLVLFAFALGAVVKYFTKELDKRDNVIAKNTEVIQQVLQAESSKREALVKEVTASQTQVTQVVQQNTEAFNRLNDTLVDKVYDLLRK